MPDYNLLRGYIGYKLNNYMYTGFTIVVNFSHYFILDSLPEY
jgi:hypothetical protein